MFTFLVPPFEDKCPLCRRPSSKGRFCSSCRALVTTWREQYSPCLYCGRLRALSGVISGTPRTEKCGQVCSQCQEELPPFSLARAAGPHMGLLKEAIHNFKYMGRRSLARPLGRLLADTLLYERAFGRPEVLVAVPLARERLQERAFNQAELLAEALGCELGIKTCRGILLKVRETVPQVGLSLRERLANLKGAFQVRLPDKVRGRRVLVVDDVLTTGATASECARVLLAAGAREVAVLTVATGIDLTFPAQR